VVLRNESKRLFVTKILSASDVKDARTNPWRTINNNIYVDFIDEVRRQQGLSGKGLTGVAAPLSSYTGKCIGNPKCPCRSNRSNSRGGCFISNRTNGGSIIQFLSSNPEELIKKLNTMLAEFQAGNNNVFNHISAIVDELRRQGILSIKSMKLRNCTILSNNNYIFKWQRNHLRY
jgi:hypothetical protein